MHRDNLEWQIQQNLSSDFGPRYFDGMRQRKTGGMTNVLQHKGGLHFTSERHAKEEQR
jgi:hypothetical protein